MVIEARDFKYLTLLIPFIYLFIVNLYLLILFAKDLKAILRNVL